MQVLDEQDDVGSGVCSADANVVQAAGDAEADRAGFADFVVADPVVGIGVADGGVVVTVYFDAVGGRIHDLGQVDDGIEVISGAETDVHHDILSVAGKAVVVRKHRETGRTASTSRGYTKPPLQGGFGSVSASASTSPVMLHIGAFKTGTTYLQTVLWENRDALREEGVFWPGGTRQDQMAAGRSLLGSQSRDPVNWMKIARQMSQWQGPSLFSMEGMSLLDDEAIHLAVESLAGRRVRIILTLRDLGRVIPSQWQELAKNKPVSGYREYLAAMMRPGDEESQHSRSFWARQDAPVILSRWLQHLPVEDVIVVAVPPAGAPGGLLWERFCEATGLSAGRFDSSVRVNESLGASAAEVMRYVSMNVPDPKDRRTRKFLKRNLANGLLATRQPRGPALVLPEEYESAVAAKSERVIEQIEELGVPVVGELSDLRPVFAKPSGPWTDDPSSIPVEDLLAVAGYALGHLCAQAARGEMEEAI